MDKEFSKDFMNRGVKFIIIILRWISLLFTVAIGGLTTAFLIMIIIQNVNFANSLIARIVSYITLYNESYILDFIQRYGSLRVVCSTLVYGVITTVTYGMIYYLLDNFITLFDNINEGKVFDKENMNKVKKAAKIAILTALLSPLSMAIEYFAVGFLGPNHAQYIGIFFAIIAYVLYLIFKQGYTLENQNKKLQKEIDKYKIKEEESKIEEVKKEVKKKKAAKIK